MISSGRLGERRGDSASESGKEVAGFGGGMWNAFCRCGGDDPLGGGLSDGLGSVAGVKVEDFLDSWVLVRIFDAGSDTMGTLDDDCLLVHGKTVGGGASTLSSVGVIVKEDA
jgi:hypothetical protein